MTGSNLFPPIPRHLIALCVLLLCQSCTSPVIPPPAQDKPLSIEGTWQQGALLKGKVKPGSRVAFLGNEVFVSEAGEFILGLGRDAPRQVEVVVTQPDGEVMRQSFEVTQRQYDIQHVAVAPKFVTPSPKDQARIDYENFLIGKARKLREPRADFAGGFIWPAEGPITGVYGSQRFYNGEGRQPHYGVDIGAPTGTPVRAPAAGKVSFVYDMYYSGWTLVLDHGQGLSSTFLHLNRVLVKEGDRVEQGQLIAEIGATGRVSGAHLDWRMNWLDQRIDPQLLVPPMPAAAGVE